jgi:hypothetical protein
MIKEIKGRATKWNRFKSLSRLSKAHYCFEYPKLLYSWYSNSLGQPYE